MADPRVTGAYMQAVINVLREKELLDDQDVEEINRQAKEILIAKKAEVEQEYELTKAMLERVKLPGLVNGAAGAVGGPKRPSPLHRPGTHG